MAARLTYYKATTPNGTDFWGEAAHIAPRSLGGGQSAASVVPLCSGCHRAYDSHRLDLIGYLHPDEQIEAVRVLGLARAYRRLGGFVDA